MIKFPDSIDIYIKAGDGGKGSVSFRREKFVPKGGPDGGNGGDGGSIYFICDDKLNSLLYFKDKHRFKAKSGGNGRGSNCSGLNGDDIYLRVPLGTEIINKETEESIHHFVTHNECICIGKGGLGGIGNGSLATSINRTPIMSKPPTSGDEYNLVLNLSIISDFALLGLPSVGKSTFMNKLTGTNYKIDSYDFTTTSPQRGRYNNDMSVLDLPGIKLHMLKYKIANILKHVKYAKCVLWVLDDRIDEFLKLYSMIVSSNTFVNDPSFIFIVNKADIMDQDQMEMIRIQLNNIIESPKMYFIASSF